MIDVIKEIEKDIEILEQQIKEITTSANQQIGARVEQINKYKKWLDALNGEGKE